jgi:hypothetical protein
MKRLLPLAAILLFLTVTAQAQSTAGSKPSLFSNFPEKISCNSSELDKAFSASSNQSLNLLFSDNFLFSGAVISNITKYTNMQSVTVKSKDFADAIFTITKITTPAGNIEYRGRIVNIKYFDGYELKKDVAGNYKLLKFETDKLLQDCKQ